MANPTIRFLALGAALWTSAALLAGQASGPKFFPDDPLREDADRALDAKNAQPTNASDIFDFASNTYLKPGEKRDIPAPNVNSLDEVPDSSWFTNRIGRRDMDLAEIVKGPDRFDTIDVQDWPITGGKGEGLQPGYRVTSPEGHTWQIEFDPPTNLEMASGAEVIGTAIYHAIGYNVVDVYIVEFDRARLKISPKATVRDPATGHRRPMNHEDLEAVFARTKPLPNGRYRGVASRFADGKPLGSFTYYGTRPDDPNDVFLHEHRRELRGNRVFAAWINHDDSRGPNSLDMLLESDGRSWVKHYMFDFGSILGSGTTRAQAPRASNEYIHEWKPGLLTLATFGLYLKPWLLIDYPDVAPSVGRVESKVFDPVTWKPEYPNPAFQNMRPEDAFWGARIVARFSNDALRKVVEKAKYSDPAATDYLTQVLVERRDKVVRTWVNGVTPLVDARLTADGRFTAGNAAMALGVAEAAGASYRAQWFTLNNDTHGEQPVGAPLDVGSASGADAPATVAMTAPPEVLAGSPYIGVRVTGAHAAHPGWGANPATFFFRKIATGWELVGVERFAPPIASTAKAG